MKRARSDERPAVEVSTEEGAALRRALGRWYARHRRDLPWRATRDPYAIWISEAMLQQTRVEVVLEPWARFLERFPDVAALAAAEEDDVVAAWSGLGYYRRARALHRAARAVMAGSGTFPRSRAELLELPGVGPYTAGAVASIAFDEPAPVVDGNVARVFARLFAIEQPIDRPAAQRALWRLATALLPPPPGEAADDEPRPGDWSQALMELGALVCTPRAPACPVCPLAERCRARAAGRQAVLPTRSARPAPVAVALELLLVERDGRVLLRRRDDGGRMARMWELPTRERGRAGSTRLWPARFPDPPTGRFELLSGPARTLAHAITCHRITAAVRPARLHGDAEPLSATWRWCAPPESAALGLTGLTRKALGLRAGG